MRYYLNDAGGWLTVDGDAEAFPGVVPDGFHEVTAEQYEQASGAIRIEIPTGGGEQQP